MVRDATRACNWPTVLHRVLLKTESLYSSVQTIYIAVEHVYATKETKRHLAACSKIITFIVIR